MRSDIEGGTMYGYKIINGKAVINEQEAEIIIRIFDGYISGMSMKAAAANAGVSMQHSAIKRILMKNIYIGTDYYPAIISRENFAKATGRRLHRANLHGCEKRYTAPPVHMAFDLSGADRHFNNPTEQIEYIYSLIEVKA